MCAPLPRWPSGYCHKLVAGGSRIANDEGVDEELLARAFRAALPALRKLSHPDDKACEIFQAYVALKNGRNYVAHNSA
ncbi:hypothetical protein TNCV_128611 [Trichonephila clavipes]|nr:hypothetical protein TNCV_128611 [Trichonephila clavipes]